jgi:hypothetical protein
MNNPSNFAVNLNNEELFFSSELNKRQFMDAGHKNQLDADRLSAELDSHLQDVCQATDYDPPKKTSKPKDQEYVEEQFAEISSVTLVDKVHCPKDKYTFPIFKDNPYKDWKSEDIVDYLESQLLENVGQYLVIRESFCALSLELNNRKLLAPAFRPKPTIPYGLKVHSETQFAIQRDRVVIDCHWLHCRNERVKASESKWKGLLNLKRDFQYEKVCEFASESIKNEYRADAILRLTPRQQFQLVALRGNKTIEQFSKLTKSTREKGKPRLPPRLETIELGINNWCEKDSRVEKYHSQYLAIGKSTELLGEVASIKQIAELTGLILGQKPLSESTMRSKLHNLKKHH